MPAPANLVHQTTTDLGVGNLGLSSVNGKDSFDHAFGHGGTTNIFDYFISSRALGEWERGKGHLSSVNVLVRDTPLGGSNGADFTNFSAGTKDIYNSIQAENYVFSEDGPAVDGHVPKFSGVTGRQIVTAGFPPGPPTYGYLHGLVMANNVSNPVTYLDIAPGEAMSFETIGVTPERMTLTATLTKHGGSWAVGQGNGALDTGTLAPTAWYHVFLIKRTDTNVVDVLFSLSATAPTMPTHYTRRRRIGAVLVAGGNLVSFIQNGDYFKWATSPIDLSITNLSTSRLTFPISVPSGIVVIARVRGLVIHLTNAGVAVWVGSILETDAAVSGNGTGGLSGIAPVAAQGNTFSVLAETDTSSRLAARSGNTNTQLHIWTDGWIDTRGR